MMIMIITPPQDPLRKGVNSRNIPTCEICRTSFHPVIWCFDDFKVVEIMQVFFLWAIQERGVKLQYYNKYNNNNNNNNNDNNMENKENLA